MIMSDPSDKASNYTRVYENIGSVLDVKRQKGDLASERIV